MCVTPFRWRHGLVLVRATVLSVFSLGHHGGWFPRRCQLATVSLKRKLATTNDADIGALLMPSA